MLRHSKIERTLDVREKSNAQYLEYVQTLYNYLVSFFDRALPLEDVHGRLTEWESSFESAWVAGQVDGWDEKSNGSRISKPMENGDGIWCPYCERNARSSWPES